LAGVEGTSYPDNYNSNFAERHPKAKRNSPREKVHDNYSFLQILQREMNLVLPEEEMNWNAELLSLEIWQTVN